jgi:hypothetical protein
MKEQLVQLINSFVAARLSGDAALQDFAAQRLNKFLGEVDIIEAAKETAASQPDTATEN